MFDALSFWLFFIVIGGFVGHQKGILGYGLALPLLLGPLGVIILFFIPAREKEEPIDENRLLLEQQLLVQHQQLEILRAQEASRAGVRPPRVEKPLRISHDGRDLGFLQHHMIKTMLAGGQLTLADLYFDPEANDWYPLETHPAFAT